KTLGVELGRMLRAEHEKHGVAFQLGRTLGSIDAAEVTLDDGTRIPADVVLLGVGVKPVLGLARDAGLAGDGGIEVNERMEPAVPGVCAAGDAAVFPYFATGERIRVEHWVVAQRQGQTAARNTLGRDEPFRSVPFFWTMQYGVSIRYV